MKKKKAHEFNNCFKYLISHLGHISRTSSYPILASSGQFPFLSTRVAIILLKIPKIMEFFCQNIKNSVYTIEKILFCFLKNNSNFLDFLMHLKDF